MVSCMPIQARVAKSNDIMRKFGPRCRPNFLMLIAPCRIGRGQIYFRDLDRSSSAAEPDRSWGKKPKPAGPQNGSSGRSGWLWRVPARREPAGSYSRSSCRISLPPAQPYCSWDRLWSLLPAQPVGEDNLVGAGMQPAAGQIPVEEQERHSAAPVQPGWR